MAQHYLVNITEDYGTNHLYNKIEGEPTVGQWYVDDEGQLFKVRLLCYEEGTITKIMNEVLSGATSIISLDDWNKQVLKNLKYKYR